MAKGSIAVIINPISGTGHRANIAHDRVTQAAAFLTASGLDGSNVFVTERAGHARELARAAVDAGHSTVVAWGGDGTINEVGTALAFTDTALAIVPSGSGNGLARELRIPFRAAAALSLARSGSERVIDAGEVDGRLFFNLAGVGLDARIAHQFALNGTERRGLARYAEITFREVMAHVPDQLMVQTATSSISASILLVAIANGRQYGNGAIVAPSAKVDDGRLDVVVVRNRSAGRVLMALPFVFAGRIDRVEGVTIEKVESVEVISPHPLVYHLDGEPVAGMLKLSARVRPHALRIKVPAKP